MGTLIATGDNGVDGLKQNISDEQKGTYYGILRVNCVVQDTKTVKFIFIIFIGDNIKVIQKAKITTHRGAVNDFIGQYHCDLSVSTKDELSQESVMEKVNSVTFMQKTKN